MMLKSKMQVKHFNEEDCLVFEDEKTIVCPRWPVRIAGTQGLWRYVQPIGDWDSGWFHAEVIGPYFPGNPSRNGGRSRIVPVANIRYAGKSAKPVDVMSVETQTVSEEAKRARRR